MKLPFFNSVSLSSFARRRQIRGTVRQTNIHLDRIATALETIARGTTVMVRENYQIDPSIAPPKPEAFSRDGREITYVDENAQARLEMQQALLRASGASEEVIEGLDLATPDADLDVDELNALIRRVNEEVASGASGAYGAEGTGVDVLP